MTVYRDLGNGFMLVFRINSDHAIKSLPEAVQTAAVRYELSVGREVKMEIPHEVPALFGEGKNRKGVGANSDVPHFQIEASNRNGGNKYASCCRSC
jgi:hypothetical protein